MKTITPPAALVAVLVLSGCAGADAVARRDLEALRAEMQAARRENLTLSRSVEALTLRVDALTARLGRTAAPQGPAAAPTPATPSAATASPQAAAVPRPPEAALVPDGLAVVKVEPDRPVRAAPALPTGVAILEPDPARVDALTRRGGRDLASDAEGELRAARKKDGLTRAHGLEDFAGRYPHHPRADRALLEAAVAYAEAGRRDAACSLSRRVVEEYPAGDAVSEALLRVATCEQERGSAEGERRLLTRLVKEFPSTPAARRAGERLAVITGPTAGESPEAGPARSGP